VRPVLFFDLDGTLIDSRHDIAEAFGAAAHALRPGTQVRVADVEPHIGRPLRLMAAELGLSLDDAEAEAFERAYRARFDELASRSSLPFPGIAPLLGELAGQRTLALVTGKIGYQARAVSEQVGLAGFFDHVQGWEPGLQPKPAPDLLVRALEACGARAGDALYVGDAPSDVEAGRAAGLATIAVTWGFAPTPHLVASRPDHLATTVAELAALLRRDDF
jgi:HAD superfamily hydrolase (TIGR01509 family)